MSKQDGTQPSTKQRRSRKTNTVDHENGKQAPAAQRPTSDDKEAWKAYWEQQGQSWRIEPEIDAERQTYLAERRTITPDIEQGIYPFKDIKLNRADLEWLLVTHENGQGPVDWNDESQRQRQGVDLRGADLRHQDLHNLPLTRLQGGLKRSHWIETTLDQRMMAEVHFERVNLRGAHLEASCLTRAHLQGADCERAHLQGADLYRVHLEGATLNGAYLGGASLRNAYLDSATNLSYITLTDKNFGNTLTADIKWSDANLAVVEWNQVTAIGEESFAKQAKTWTGRVKDKSGWLSGYQSAVRANRQLAVVLRDQGLNEEADQFAYRAQLLQREVWRRQRRILKYALSWFLYLIAGYGYKPIRSGIWYLIIIFGFAVAYSTLGHLSPIPDALVFSLTSFHGRGFFPGLGNEISLHNPLVVLAAIEAVVGLFIEISFIATFTQRFFGK